MIYIYIMRGGNLLSQGAYGCVYLPALTCKGSPTNNFDYVSKLQILNFSALNEIRMGKKIRSITDFFYYFVPITSHCEVNIGAFDDKDCTILKKERKSPFVLMKMPFVGYRQSYKPYMDYLLTDVTPREIVLDFISSYQHLLQAIQILIQNNICHFDLNAQNILFSQQTTVPLVIDFGLSIDIPKMKEQLKNYFYVYAPNYYIWPLEVHYINFILHVNSSPSLGDLKNLASTFVKNNKVLQENFSPEFLHDYEEACVEQLKTYTDLDTVLSFWKTWDNYTLGVLYLQILHYLWNSQENAFIAAFVKLLVMTMHPNPRRRPSLHDTKKIFASFFSDVDVNKAENYENILIGFKKNRHLWVDKIKQDKTVFETLVKRYSRKI